MKLTVANRDRTADLGRECAAVSESMAGHFKAPRFMSEADSALSLRESRTEKDYMTRVMNLMWYRTGVDVSQFFAISKPGILPRIMRKLRGIAWSLLRFSPVRLGFQQNTVNLQMTAAMEFMRQEYQREIEHLKARLAELEKNGRGA